MSSVHIRETLQTQLKTLKQNKILIAIMCILFLLKLIISIQCIISYAECTLVNLLASLSSPNGHEFVGSAFPSVSSLYLAFTTNLRISEVAKLLIYESDLINKYYSIYLLHI